MGYIYQKIYKNRANQSSYASPQKVPRDSQIQTTPRLETDSQQNSQDLSFDSLQFEKLTQKCIESALQKQQKLFEEQTRAKNKEFEQKDSELAAYKLKEMNEEKKRMDLQKKEMQQKQEEFLRKQEEFKAQQIEELKQKHIELEKQKERDIALEKERMALKEKEIKEKEEELKRIQ